MARTRSTRRRATTDVEAGEAVTVTRETFEALLLASAGQAAAIAQGAAAPARTTTRERAGAPSGGRPGPPHKSLGVA